MSGLTEPQTGRSRKFSDRDILQQVREINAEDDCMPTASTKKVKDGVGYSSRSAALDRLNQLADKGYLHRKLPAGEGGTILWMLTEKAEKEVSS